jgi:tetratricopeptide (TPR) repeat protein
VVQLSRLRITPIGTCRIHTPLKQAVARYPIKLDLRRNYGFVHTSAEALQLVRYLQGEKQFRPEVAPVVARDADFGAFEGVEWSPADLHFVEVSSSKVFRSGDEVVQSNYITRHFADFFASVDRTRKFWTLVRKGHRQDLLDFVRDEPCYRRLPPADRDLLLSLSLEQQSYRGLQADMAEIVERLGKDQVIFVTHVNAVTPDDSIIAGRDRLIRLVKAAAEDLAVPVFDPTEAMRKFGQERAMENGGLDLTHFTPSFSDAVYDELHVAHVAPFVATRPDLQRGAAAVDEGAVAAARLAARLEIDQLEVAGRKVHEAVRQHPDSLPLIELRGVVRTRVGDFEGAVADLTRRGDDLALTETMRIALAESLYMIGEPSRALAVLESLISDEFESAAIYSLAAEVAQQAGNPDQAVFYAKQAFRRDRGDLAAALRGLKVATNHCEPAEVAEWRAEILDNMSRAAAGTFEVCLWAIDNRDDAMFAAALRQVARSDKAGAIDLLEKAAEAGMARAVADSIEAANGMGRLESGHAVRRSDLVQWALDEATRLFEQDRAVDAHYVARAIHRLDGNANSQLRSERLVRLAARLMRLVEKHVRTSVRAAFAAGDQDAVIRLGEQSHDILRNDPDTAIIVARSLHSSGREAEAIELLVGVQSENPDHFGAKRSLGRFAALAGKYGVALRMYGSLDRSDPRFEKVTIEVERFFANAERRAIVQLRELFAADKTEEAFELVEALKTYTDAGPACERVLERAYRNARRRLVEIEQGNGDIEDREPLLRLMLRIDPEDASALRRLALECMRQFRFAEAAECWETLRSLNPNNESVVRNRERCRTLAQRRASSSVVEVAA